MESCWLSILCDALPGIVWSTDADLTLTALRGSGTGPDLLGRTLQDALRLTPDHPALLAHRRALAGDSAGCDVPWPGRTVRARLEPIRDAAGAIVGVAGAAFESVRSEAVVQDRSAFLAALEPRLRTGELAGAALVLLDVDGLGSLNARLGHEAGDVVLREVARRLSSHVRAVDLLARTGGDEFAVVIPGAGEASRVAERLRAALAEPVDVKGERVPVHASAGFVRLRPEQKAFAALQEAEAAMARAKADGRDRCVAGAGAQDQRTASLQLVEAELRRALGRDDMRAHFEPMVAVKSGRVDGFEVLLWRRTARTASAKPAPTSPA